MEPDRTFKNIRKGTKLALDHGTWLISAVSSSGWSHSLTFTINAAHPWIVFPMKMSDVRCYYMNDPIETK